MPPTESDPGRPAHLARRLRLARWALAWEQIWPALVPPLGLGGIFAALALFDVLPLLPGWAHAAILALLVFGVVRLLWRGIRRIDWPDDRDAARRLERDSGLLHRPLAALEDRLAGPGDDPLTRSLWRAHRARMAALARRLRLAPPSPGMAARDPLGLRAAVILLLVVAAAAGGADAPRRLARALSPVAVLPGWTPALATWITPPAYTHLPALPLTPGDATKPIAVPTGSTVTAALTGGWGGADLILDGQPKPLAHQPDGGQRIEAKVTAGTRLALRQAWREVAGWPITVIADSLPSIDFTEPPQVGERGRLRLAVAASDDYGIGRVWVEFRRAEAPEEAPFEVELAVPASQPRSLDSATWHDLTAHPWAGLVVSARPMVEDNAGQVAGGEAVTLELPERTFANPVARAIIDQRRQIGDDRSNGPEAAAALAEIATHPETFRDDKAVFLALVLARTLLAEDDFDLAAIQDLLWNAALRIEEGERATAERRLEDTRAALDQALADNASTAALERLLDEYQAALAAMLDSMASNQNPDGAAPSADARILGPEELQQMLETMRAMAAIGSREALRHMLDDMGQLMAELRNAPANAGPAGKAAAELRALARGQQRLLDQSFRHSDDKADAQANAQAQAQAQQGLRRRLEELIKGLGETIPDTLSAAASAMSAAADHLGQGAWLQAAEAQAQALQRLDDSADQLARQTIGAPSRDPLGRALPGRVLGDDGTTRLPAQAEIQRAQHLLNELRRRAGEWNRPEEEREYLQRLLKRF